MCDSGCVERLRPRGMPRRCQLCRAGRWGPPPLLLLLLLLTRHHDSTRTTNTTTTVTTITTTTTAAADDDDTMTSLRIEHFVQVMAVVLEAAELGRVKDQGGSDK